jgi:PKD repeat protein
MKKSYFVLLILLFGLWSGNNQLKAQTANAGADIKTCQTYVTLVGNQPASGTGKWTIVTGTPNIVSPTTYNTLVNDLTPGITTLRWTITPAQGSATFDDVDITVEPLKAEFTIKNTSYLGGNDGSISAIVSGGTAPYTGLWSTGEQGLTIENLQAGVYPVIFRSAEECMLKMFPEVKEPKADTCIFTADFTYSNDGNYFSFKSIETNQNLTYIWTFGNGKQSNQMSPVTNYTEPGIYDVSLAIYNDLTKCYSVKTKTIVVGESACMTDYGFYYDKADLTTVRFSINSVMKATTSYFWNFGDGSYSTAAAPSHQYKSNGIYNVCLVTKDIENECQAQRCRQILINNGQSVLTANFRYLVSARYKSVAFVDLSSGTATGRQWDFGDGTYGTKKDELHQYTRSGQYKVCLNVYNETTKEKSQKCENIYVVGVGEVGIAAAYEVFIDPTNLSAAFTNKSTGNYTNLAWDFGDGTYSKEVNPVHVYPKSGAYNVCLSVFESTTKTISQNCKKVEVVKPGESTCVANFSVFIDELTRSVEFIDLSTGNPDVWYWTLSDGTAINKQNLKHIFAKAGKYEVCLHCSNTTAKSYSKKCIEIQVGQPECTIETQFTKFVYPGTNEIQFTEAPVNASGTIQARFWDFGDGSTSTNANPNHKYVLPGNYTVTLGLVDDMGCLDEYTEVVTVGEIACKAEFSFNVVDLEKKIVELKNWSKGNNLKYYWEFGDGTTSTEITPTYQFTKTGLFNLKLTVSNTAGTCFDAFSLPIQIGTVDCNADFQTFIDSATRVVYFKHTSFVENTKYLWVFGDGDVSTGSNPSHTFTQPGFYMVSLTVYNQTKNCFDHKTKAFCISKPGDDIKADFAYEVDNTTKTLRINDKSLGKNLSYIWDFGDGTKSDVKSPEPHVYLNSNYYNVCLLITNDQKISNLACKQIKVGTEQTKACLANFAYMVDPATKEVRFEDKSFGEPDNFVWTFADGQSTQSITKQVNHTYASEGYYLVGLAIQNSTTGCKSEHYELINVAKANNGLQGDFIFKALNSKKKGKGHPVDFIGTSLGEPASVKWNFGDGSMDSTNTNITHTYSADGSYTVCFTVSDPITKVQSKQCKVLTVTAVNDIADIENGFSQYPNPFSTSSTITLAIDKTSKIKIEVFDVFGKKVGVLVNKTEVPGIYTYPWDRGQLQNGIYMLKLTSDKYTVSRKVIITK